MIINKFNVLSFSAIILLFTQFCYGQTFNLQNIPGEKLQIGLKFHKPFYAEELFSASSYSGAYDLNFNFPVSGKFNLNVSVPFIATSYDLDFLGQTYKYEESGMGNIFIAMQTRPETPEDTRSTISFGLYLPTADELAAGAGAYADYYSFPKYIAKVVGVYFNYAYHKMPKKGFHYGLEVGPDFMIPTKKGENTELFLHYAATGGYQIDNFLINTEILGNFVVTEDFDNFSDRFVHMIDFGIQISGDVIQPKIYYGIYMKDGFNDIVDGVLGIGLTFLFR